VTGPGSTIYFAAEGDRVTIDPWLEEPHEDVEAIVTTLSGARELITLVFAYDDETAVSEWLRARHTSR
jgi:hypothetical protein